MGDEGVADVAVVTRVVAAVATAVSADADGIDSATVFGVALVVVAVGAIDATLAACVCVLTVDGVVAVLAACAAEVGLLAAGGVFFLRSAAVPPDSGAATVAPDPLPVFPVVVGALAVVAE